MITVVIRNKNEAKALEKTLSILTNVYKNDISQIIIVDNNSTDASKEIGAKYGCKIISIENFSYGKATNLGISNADTNFVLLLSAHAIPIGKSFFKNSLEAIQDSNAIAGIRYINSIENYERAIQKKFKVDEPLKYGLMTACALINKDVWNKFKFNEDLVFAEDKEWSERVVNNGFEILDLNETFFYFSKLSKQAKLNRYKNETIADYQLNNKIFPNPLKILLSFFKKIFFTNIITYIQLIKNDFLTFKTKLVIYKKLKNNKG